MEEFFKKYIPQLLNDLRKMSREERLERGELVDEAGYLGQASAFIEKEVGCLVEVYAGDDETAYDPKGKAGHATPWRPAIYIE